MAPCTPAGRGTGPTWLVADNTHDDSRLTGAWWVFNEPIQKWVQEEITHASAQVEVEARSNNLYVIRAEVTCYSDKAFDDVQFDIQLRSKPDDITGQIYQRNGNQPKLTIEPKKNDSNAFVIAENAAIAFHELMRLRGRAFLGSSDIFHSFVPSTL